MEEKNNTKLIVSSYLLEEGKFNAENYPQIIEIMNTVPESLNFVMEDPRTVLISENAYREDINRYRKL